jgi:NAD+ kinase
VLISNQKQLTKKGKSMGMPNNLVLVRHGESEGNIAVARSKKGDHSAYEGEFKRRHSSLWRLSKEGANQASLTGDWIKKHLNIHFDRFYASEYLRAMETAALLDIENAKWFTEFYLRERNWGSLDRASVLERNERFQESMDERSIDPFYWTPPNGESLAELCIRIDRVIQTLHRECDGKNVIIVCHGEVMWAFRVRLERMPQETFHLLDSSKNPIHRINNCQVIHYTRTNPEKNGESPRNHLNWMRSICPWNHKLSRNTWQSIHRPNYSNLDLLNRVEKIKPLISSFGFINTSRRYNLRLFHLLISASFSFLVSLFNSPSLFRAIVYVLHFLLQTSSTGLRIFV